jgi:ketosteroid isomerase-like protein
MDIRTSSGLALADRLRDAVKRHDLDALARCFATDFVNETPAHPARSFRGREQVRKNWAQIFAAVPNLEADLVDVAIHDDTVWTEWEMRGTRLDGAHHLMRGVSIFGVGDDAFTSVRFYLEPVDQAGAGIDAAVQSALAR